MLLFNGLYFRGDWAQSFKKLDDLKPFNGNKGKHDTKFILSESAFKFAEVSSHNLQAVEILYKV